MLASRTISYFEEGAVTQSSGLEIGDTLLAINGRRLYIADDIVYELVRIKDGHADVVVLRDLSLIHISCLKNAYVKRYGELL